MYRASSHESCENTRKPATPMAIVVRASSATGRMRLKGLDVTARVYDAAPAWT